MAGPLRRDFYPRAVIVCACDQRLESPFAVSVVLSCKIKLEKKKKNLCSSFIISDSLMEFSIG